jgi:hypothetical protein
LAYKAADDFEELIQERLQTLVGEPMIGMASSKNKAVRYIVLTKHNKLYYTIVGKAIIVLNILDIPPKSRKKQVLKSCIKNICRIKLSHPYLHGNDKKHSKYSMVVAYKPQQGPVML